MNEYDYDLWSLDVNNFETRKKGEIISKERRNNFETRKEGEIISHPARNCERNSKYERKAKELRNIDKVAKHP